MDASCRLNFYWAVNRVVWKNLNFYCAINRRLFSSHNLTSGATFSSVLYFMRAFSSLSISVSNLLRNCRSMKITDKLLRGWLLRWRTEKNLSWLYNCSAAKLGVLFCRKCFVALNSRINWNDCSQFLNRKSAISSTTSCTKAGDCWNNNSRKLWLIWEVLAFVEIFY